MKRSLDPLRKDAKKIFLHAVRAADPQSLLLSQVSLRQNVLRVGKQKYPLSRYQRIWVAGTGKACAVMARSLEKVLGPRIAGGLINVKYGHGQKLKKIRVQEAGHPVPDDKGLQGAREMAEMLSRLGEEDLVIFLISGGGSALLPSPREGITLAEKQATTNLLLGCGATIQEINAVRKHLSVFERRGAGEDRLPCNPRRPDPVGRDRGPSSRHRLRVQRFRTRRPSKIASGSCNGTTSGKKSLPPLPRISGKERRERERRR